MKDDRCLNNLPASKVVEQEQVLLHCFRMTEVHHRRQGGR
jgi:hypothetical protein